MFSKRKYNAENNKIGKNDNIDIGNNKNNKSKEIIKNSEINSFNYNPNEVTISLIKEIAKKESAIHKKIQILKKCEECKKIVNEKLDYIDNLIKEISEKYDLETQLLNFNLVIKDPSQKINNLNKTKKLISDFLQDSSCKKHRKLYEIIELERVEVNSLKESISLLRDKI